MKGLARYIDSVIAVAGTWSEELNQICLMSPFPFPPAVPSGSLLSLANAGHPKPVKAPGPDPRTAGTSPPKHGAGWGQVGVPTRDGAAVQLPLLSAKTAERASNDLAERAHLRSKEHRSGFHPGPSTSGAAPTTGVKQVVPCLLPLRTSPQIQLAFASSPWLRRHVVPPCPAPPTAPSPPSLPGL